MHTGRLTRAPGGSVLVQKIVASKHLRCRPTPDFILAKPSRLAWKNYEEKLRRPHSALKDSECSHLCAFFNVLAGSQVCLCHLQPSRGINRCFT